MDQDTIRYRFRALLKLPAETECVEFKLNNDDPEEIGQYISAIGNAAALHGEDTGFIVWGVEDGTRRVAGTTFRPRQAKVGNEELENWLAHHLSPRIDFVIHEFVEDNLPVVVFEVPRATSCPIQFRNERYVRCGTYKKHLRDFPEKERKLWESFTQAVFETRRAVENLDASSALDLLDYPAYFSLVGQHLPTERESILRCLVDERFLVTHDGVRFAVTNLGLILFARRLDQLPGLGRKALRVIVYPANDRVSAKKDRPGVKGYAVGFARAVDWILDQVPQHEEIAQTLRVAKVAYPAIAVRELLANALVHQDFALAGAGPMVEVFANRIEVTNPGVPLIDTMRFIDHPPRSRNEALASFMRRIKICEERGSGIDKVVSSVEDFLLPAPEFSVVGDSMRAVLHGPRGLTAMSKEDRVRACYQHACLRYVSAEVMTNASLRRRFSIEDRNYPMASRIIADTIAAKLVKQSDPENRSRKHATYVPYWA
jgi:predicted HTH transcriptional regulator